MFDWLSSVGSAVSSAFSSVAGSISSGVSAIAETVSPQKWSQIGRQVMEDIQKAAGYPRGRADKSEVRKPPQAAPTRKHIPTRIRRLSKVHKSDAAKRAYYRKHGTSTLRKAGVDLNKRARRSYESPEVRKPVPKTKPFKLPEIKLPVSLVQAAKKVKIPEVKLPVETKEKPFTVQNPIDVVIEARNKAYEIGASEAVKGFQKGDVVRAGAGAGVFAGTAAADVALPLDLANVTNKVLTGRMNELDLEDWLWAGVDALAIGAGVLTAGLGYAGVKGLKAALKGTKVVGEAGKMAKEIGKAGKIVSEAGEVGKVLKGGEEMGKFSGLFKGFEALKFEKGLKLPEMPHFKVPDIKPKVPIELEAYYGKFLRKPELPHFKPRFKPEFKLSEFKPRFKPEPKFLKFKKAPELPKLTKTEEAFKSVKGVEAFEEAKVARFTEPLKGEIKTAGTILEEAGKSAKLSREIEAVSKGGKLSKLRGALKGATTYAAVGLGGAALMYSAVKGQLQEAEEREKELLEYIKQLEEKLKKYENMVNNGQMPVDEYLSYYLAYLQQMLDQLYNAYVQGMMSYDEYISQLYDYVNGYLEELNRQYEKGMLSLQDYIAYLEDYLNYLNQLYSQGYIDDNDYQELYDQIMKELQDALNEYYSQYGEYPAGYEQYAGEGRYFEPAYGEFFAPVEYAAQDLTRILDDIPVVGGVFKEARKHGLAFPAVLGFAGLTIAGGYYLFAKKKLHKKVGI